MKKILSGFFLVMLVLGESLGRVSSDRYGAFLFGVDYYPEQWPESYWEQDAKWMQECGVNAARMGEFAWALMEPEEGAYNFDLFDRAIALLAKHGIRTILGTPTAAPPKWLTRKYPEVLHVFADGRAANDQSRRHYCYNSPVYRQFSKKIVEAMASHYRDNPNVIGWQIDNEFNNENRECYSESCRAAFRGWLKAKYGKLDSLNERWGARFWSQWYTAWEQIDLPFHTPAFHNPTLMLEYKRFISDSVRSYQQDQIEIIRKYRPGDFITHNGPFKNIDYYEFSRDLDIFAHSNYPTFNAVPQYQVGATLTMLRGFQGRFMIMEQQTGPGGQTYLLRSPRPGEMNLWAFQAIAHGAEGIIHFRWRTARRGAEEYWSGVLEHDNIPRGRFQEFKKEGSEVGRIGRQILGSKLLSEIAVVKDFDAEWVFDYQYFTSEVNLGAEFVNFFQAASEMKYNIDFISPRADFSRYQIIFGPHLILMDPDLAQKIKRFVEQGGTFVLSAHSAVKNRDNVMTDQVAPILLDDLFGVERDEFNCYQPPSRDKNSLRFEDGGAIPVNVFADALSVKGARAIALWDRDYLKGMPACTENRIGKGKAVYYGSFFNLDSARYLIRRYADERQLSPIFSGFPKEVEVTRRTKDGIHYYLLLNHADESVTVKPGAGYFDLLAGKEAPSSFVLQPFEYKVLKRSVEWSEKTR